MSDRVRLCASSIAGSYLARSAPDAPLPSLVFFRQSAARELVRVGRRDASLLDVRVRDQLPCAGFVDARSRAWSVGVGAGAGVCARGFRELVDWRDKNAQGGGEAGDEMAVRSRTIRNAGHQGSWLPDKRCEAYIQDGVGPRQVRVISAGIRPRTLDVHGFVANTGDRSRLRGPSRVGPRGSRVRALL